MKNEHEETAGPVAREQSPESIFGPVIYQYTRKQALDDGAQVDMNHVTDASGRPMVYFKFPLYFTRGAYEATIAAGGRWVPQADGGEALELPDGQDLPGRFHDVCFMLINAIRGQRGPRVSFALYVRTDRSRLVKLVSVCGALDIDDPQPAITVMLPEED